MKSFKHVLFFVCFVFASGFGGLLLGSNKNLRDTWRLDWDKRYPTWKTERLAGEFFTRSCEQFGHTKWWENKGKFLVNLACTALKAGIPSAELSEGLRSECSSNIDTDNRCWWNNFGGKALINEMCRRLKLGDDNKARQSEKGSIATKTVEKIVKKFNLGDMGITILGTAIIIGGTVGYDWYYYDLAYTRWVMEGVAHQAKTLKSWVLWACGIEAEEKKIKDVLQKQNDAEKVEAEKVEKQKTTMKQEQVLKKKNNTQAPKKKEEKKTMKSRIENLKGAMIGKSQDDSPVAAGDVPAT